jgi:CBS domain-containing protein
MRINDVLRSKPSGAVVTIRPEATVRELIELMAEHNVGALVVSHDGTAVEGIVSERDVVRRLVTNDALLSETVASIMTEAVHRCTPDQHVNDLMVLMTDHRIRHVPVVEDGRLTGIISIGDVVKSRIGELEFERDQLDRYLHQT